MLRLIHDYYEWRSRRDLEFLEKSAGVLRSEDEVLAITKRMRYLHEQLKEAPSWFFSRRAMKLRGTADEQLQLMIKCVLAAHRLAMRFPSRGLPKELAKRLEPALGTAPSNFEEAEQGFRKCRTK